MVLARPPFSFMHLLYLDDAGSVGNPSDKHFVLAGIAVFERQTHWLDAGLENLAGSLGYSNPSDIEFHGNQILSGRGPWRRIPRVERRSIIRRGLETAWALRGEWRLFGAVVDKRERSPEDPIEYAFEQLCNRFDRFLTRLHHKGDSQRGLIVLDKSTRETRLQSLATEFKTEGHRWGFTRNLADVPLFVDSKATRLIQYADLVSYALWRKFEKQDNEFFNAVSDAFDREGSVVHGLHHYKNRSELCDCPGCMTS